jgi:hypothetical protein
MKIFLLFGSAIVLLTGCTTKYTTRTDPSRYTKTLPSGYETIKDFFYARVNEAAKDKSVTIKTTDGEEWNGLSLHVSIDSFNCHQENRHCPA